MKREIKYRFWSGSKMFYDLENVMECLKQQLAHTYNHSKMIQYDHVGEHKADFLEYTGLKDKNGKEIYEADIIKLYSGLYIIEYVAPEFIRRHVRKELRNQTYSFSDLTPCEVIGNLHENPELLNPNT